MLAEKGCRKPRILRANCTVCVPLCGKGRAAEGGPCAALSIAFQVLKLRVVSGHHYPVAGIQHDIRCRRKEQLTVLFTYC